MSHTGEPDWDLLATYLSGEATAEEERSVEEWIGNDPKRQELVDQFKRSWEVPGEVFDSIDLATVADGILRRLNESVEMADHARRPNAQARQARRFRNVSSGEERGGKGVPGRGPLRWSAWSVLQKSVFAGAIVLTVMYLTRLGLDTHKASTRRVYTTGTTQQALVALNDGSTIVLAPETHLVYTVDQTGVRSVELLGEAFFTITHGANRPFVVHTGSVTTRVLGTAFDIRRYPGDPLTEVAVARGRVLTRGHNSATVLDAGMIARVTDSTTVVERVADSTRLLGWTEGNLIFNHAPVSTVLATLGRWYGYEFRLADTTLARQFISVDFQTNQIAEAMAALRVVLGVTMTFDGKVVTLHPTNGRSTTQPRNMHAPFDHPKVEVGK